MTTEFTRIRVAETPRPDPNPSAAGGNVPVRPAARPVDPTVPASEAQLTAGTGVLMRSHRDQQGIDTVKGLQNRLTELGYLQPGGVDGNFGRQTESAVREFQSRNGLAADGIVGPQTHAALARTDAVRHAAQQAPTPEERRTSEQFILARTSLGAAARGSWSPELSQERRTERANVSRAQLDALEAGLGRLPQPEQAAARADIRELRGLYDRLGEQRLGGGSNYIWSSPGVDMDRASRAEHRLIDRLHSIPDPPREATGTPPAAPRGPFR